MSPNDYDQLSDSYEESHEKPDKKYSMVPTMEKILNPLKNKIVIDVGCGDGFFTEKLSKKSKFVYGIDNSKEQITKTKKRKAKNISYILEDMFKYDYPDCQIIWAPFVINYVKEKEDISKLFKKFYNALEKNGKLGLILDMPKKSFHDSKKWGAIKKIENGELKEGAKMQVELYNGNKHIITLHSFYHTRETIEEALKIQGFKKITWHKPIISKEGLQSLGKDFWGDYSKECDLGYLTAMKI